MINERMMQSVDDWTDFSSFLLKNIPCDVKLRNGNIVQVTKYINEDEDNVGMFMSKTSEMYVWYNTGKSWTRADYDIIEIL